MKIASEALTRVCVLGGDWNGHAVDGAETLQAEPYVTAAFRTFESFWKAVDDVIALRPYVHYDDDRGRVIRITDVVSCGDGLEVRRLYTPARQPLVEWYEFGLARRNI